MSAVSSAVTGSPFSTTAPLVKICGLKTSEAALTATEAGADLLGLIFVPGSKRHVSLSQAQEIITSVRTRQQRSSSSSSSSAAPTLDTYDWFSLQSSRIASHPRKPLFVGVFQNPILSELLHTIDTLQLDAVQFHGSEPTHWAKLVNVPVIRAFHVDEKAEADPEEAAQLREATRPGFHSLALLDTKVSKAKGALSGGAGKVFDWGVARRVVDSRREEGQGRLPIVLAGGLDASNIKEGIETVRPFAVDVSGGVETNGEKDLDKIREFIKLAKST